MLFLAILACFDPNARMTTEAPASDSGAHDSGSGDEAPDTAIEDTGAPDTADDTADTAPVEPIVIAIDLVEPTTVSTVGGDPITLYGGPYAADALVSIGSGAGTVSAWTETTLSVITPAGPAGPVNVAVTTSAGAGSTAGALTYVKPCDGIVASPSSWNFSPAGADNSTTVTLTGCATGVAGVTELYTSSNGSTYGLFWDDVPASIDGAVSVTLRWDGNPQVLGSHMTAVITTDQGSATVDVMAG